LFLKASFFFSYSHASSLFCLNLQSVSISLTQVNIQLFQVYCVYTAGACKHFMSRMAHVIMSRSEDGFKMKL
jgi:hypothetical protein